MRLIIVLFLLASAAFSCQKQEKRPANILSEEKLVRVLIDYSLSQSVDNTNLYLNKLKNYKEFNFVDSIFKHHGINRAIFDSTISYYSQDPKKLEAIYDRVINEFRKRSADIENKLNQQKKVKSQKTEAKPNDQKKTNSNKIKNLTNKINSKKTEIR